MLPATGSGLTYAALALVVILCLVGLLLMQPRRRRRRQERALRPLTSTKYQGFDR